MEPTKLPTEVAGERVRYAENQPQYVPVDAVRQVDREYRCYRLLTAFVPDEIELVEFARTFVALCAMLPTEMPLRDDSDGQEELAAIADRLKAAFERHPVLLSQLSGTGMMTPHNLHLGVAPYLTTTDPHPNARENV